MSPLSGTSARTGLLRTLIHVMAGIGSLAVAGMIVVTVADVAGRQAGLPVPGAYDLVRVLGAVAMACALPLTKAVKGHIAIEYFFQKLDRRGRAVVDTLMRLVLLVLFGLLAWQFGRQGLLFRDSGEVTATLHMPMFWVPWLASLACLVTAGVTLWHLLHPGRSMMRPRG
ncbi:MAG TPA: TRAP transporter small permease subunit [Kiritimatiellia bacterium]|nr:TRAP transporter small permease subunit [Kiritimatiellia bacterium]HPR69267.1 TRAP transporter small permease subunit [Kiritimatiellia bacterium]HRX06649.1 TRAP transporter small permease subunit [Kiritimatiellia bacterium]